MGIFALPLGTSVDDGRKHLRVDVMILLACILWVFLWVFLGFLLAIILRQCVPPVSSMVIRHILFVMLRLLFGQFVAQLVGKLIRAFVSSKRDGLGLGNGSNLSFLAF